MCLLTCVYIAPCAFGPDISRCRSAWNGQRVHSTWISSLGPRRSLTSRPGVRRASCCTGEARAGSSSTEFGVFRLAEPPGDPIRQSGTAGLMLTAARVTVTPGTASIGIAFTGSRLPESFHDLSGHFDDDGVLSSEDFYVNGRRRRLEVEGRWTTGRLTIKGELFRQADSREGESVSNRDLSDLIVDGGYVSGLWRIVGSPRRSRRAVDVAVRLRVSASTAPTQSDAPSLSPRADHIAPLRQDALTFGATLAGEPLGQGASQRDPRVIRRRNGHTTRDTAGSVEEPDATPVRDVNLMSDRHRELRVIRVAGLLAFLLLLRAGSVGAQTASTLFDDSALHTLQIAIHSRDWDRLRSTYLENDYYPADLTWNGIRVTNVGVRSRGRGTRSRRQAWSEDRLRSLQHARSVPGTAGARSRQSASGQVDDSGTRGHGVPPALWRSGFS